MSHVIEDQSEVFHFLALPATYGVGAEVKRIDTHGAAVFLVGGDAYKVKRAVRFPFMDFSTLAKRQHACEQEVVINRANAPDVYLGVLPIVRRDGALHLGGEGETIEWVVHMRRFAEDMTLDRVAERGELTADIIRRTASTVSASHERAPMRLDVDFAADLRRLIIENGESLGENPAVFGTDRINALTNASLEWLNRVEDLLRRRAAEGKVRRSHGDLHLRNLVLIDGQPTLFDAIEFDDRLATTDVLYDLAFLLMDIDERGLRAEANLLLNRYLVECRDEAQLAGMAALPLFISVRAAIRAKVVAASLGTVGPGDRAAVIAEAQRYFAFAESALVAVPARLVAVGGLSGTGKTTLAERLAPRIGRLPGAVHLRSDVERKLLLNVPEFERLPGSAYDRVTSKLVYEALRRKAETVLRTGQSVMVDAVHEHLEDREALAGLAERLEVRFTGLWLEAPLPVLIERVRGRRRDASDADAAIVAGQAERSIGAIAWHCIASGSDMESVAEAARAALADAAAE